jgi:phosphate/sulfate permease
LRHFASIVESLITVALVLAGVIGISYRSFREGGWVSQAFGKVVDAYISYPLIALAVTIALYFVYRSLQTRMSKGQGGKIFDYLVYALMAGGIYFIGHFVLRGTL